MVKLRLLNGGGYTFFEGVKFPVEVEAFERCLVGGFDVAVSELELIGASSIVRCKLPHDTDWYFNSKDCELVE